MASRGQGRRGRPRGASREPPVFEEQAFVEAVGIGAVAVRPEKIPIFGKMVKRSFR